MQNSFAIIALICSAAPISRAADALQTWVNEVDMKAKMRVLMDCMNDLEVLTCSNVVYCSEIVQHLRT